MKTKFIDTNIILRFILQDIGPQAEKANEIFEDGLHGEYLLKTNSIVVFEVVWVLQSFYKSDKKIIVETLERLLLLPFLDIENSGIFHDAITLYESGSYDFVDCYNAIFAKASGADELLTFDKKAPKVN